VGVHIAAHSFYDEGIEHCLDFLKETAGVNMLFVTSNSYYGAMFRPKEAQGYHGVPIRDGRDRKVTKIFFKPDEVKAINAKTQVGRHIDHAQTSWDIFFRAAMPYARMIPCSDFLKISTYHDILGPRLAHRLEAGYCQTILRGLPPQEALDFFYAITGHNPSIEPSFERLAEEGLSPEYVFRETKRAVDGVTGKSRICSGIAIDIPQGQGWGTEASPSDPEEIYRAVIRGFDAGASGIVVCREYEEMHEASLRAVGQAIRDLTKPA